jgi:hypothetical protein
MPRISRILAIICVFSALLPALCHGQDLRVQSTPFSAYLDFQVLSKSPGGPLPKWIRSFQREVSTRADGSAIKTFYRLRIDQLTETDHDMLVRIFYHDSREDAFMVTGWTDLGAEKFARGPFGIGLHLPTSETLVVPVKGGDTIVIDAHGDGSNIRGVFLSWLGRVETRQALDFMPPPAVSDPFDNPPTQFPPLDDLFLSGRVRATIDHGLVKLMPRTLPSQTWEFELKGAPFVAMLSFEILNADPLAPLEVLVNDQPLGPIAIRAPDLADPAYQGTARSVDRGVQFRYAGWLQCQKAIPGSALKAGTNRIQLRIANTSGPVAVRSVEMQLKTQWQNFDKTFTPSTP